jgi:hypothetical protein
MKIQDGVLQNSDEDWIKAVTEAKIKYDYKLCHVWRYETSSKKSKRYGCGAAGEKQSARPALYNSDIALVGTAQDRPCI